MRSSSNQRPTTPAAEAGLVRGQSLRGAALFVLAALVYLPALRCGFVWDDPKFLTENPLIHAPDGLWRFWFSTEPPDYFPLTSTTLWIEWRLWGADAPGYHAVNVVLHATGCVLLWRVLLRLQVPGAWLAAALFAVHPVNVESVVWVTQRKNTLPLVFFLLALLAWLRFEDGSSARTRWRDYLAALICFLLALLAKTSVVVLPAVLLLCASWRRGRVTRTDLVRVVPFFALSLILGLVTVWYQTYSAIGEDVVREDGLVSRLLIAGRAVWFYLGKALLPTGLCFVYPRWEVDVTSWLAWLPFVLLVAAGVVLWRWRADVARPLRFVLGYYVLCLLPVLGFVNIYFMRYSLVADHYQYLALMGVLALAAAALAELGARWRATGAVGAASAVLVVVLGWMTWREQSAWRDEETLWRATLARNPDAWMAHNNLGVLRFRRGATVEAISHYETALRLDPDYAGAHHNLGDALQSQGRFDDAIAHYRETTRLEPKFADAHNNLGNALLATRRFDEAVASFRAALELRPDHALAHVNLGSALDELGRCEEAVAEHEAALRLDPSLAVAHYDLGNSLQKLGRAPEAARHYERALELAPNTAAFENKLAWLLATSSQLDPRRAVELAQRVVKRTGSRESVPLDTLAAAHAAAGDFDQAVRVALQAVELAPPALQAAMRQRLDGYRAGRPWREEPVARPTSH